MENGPPSIPTLILLHIQYSGSIFNRGIWTPSIPTLILLHITLILLRIMYIAFPNLQPCKNKCLPVFLKIKKKEWSNPEAYTKSGPPPPKLPVLFWYLEGLRHKRTRVTIRASTPSTLIFQSMTATRYTAQLSGISMHHSNGTLPQRRLFQSLFRQHHQGERRETFRTSQDRLMGSASPVMV